ncbi:MAG: YdaS family helix-turn-helix protein [Mesorhizobium sp.]
MDAVEALKVAVSAAGSQNELGRQIGGYSQNAIHQAMKAGRMSAVMARKIDEWSDGALSRHDMCPDAFGAPPPNVASMNFTAGRTQDGTVIVVDRETGLSTSGLTLAEAIQELRRRLAGRQVA